ncbi:MAG: tetraacyldisaccharide 4'-kinase [Pseudomonadota bacterium]
MPLKEPNWWYASPPRWEARALAPFALAFGYAAQYRHRLASPYRARLPVICVGNLTAGGTGKTPLSLLIAEDVRRIGRQPVFLTRGYGGRATGPHWVDTATDRAHDVGDEALLLADAAPTVVARRRDKGAAEIEANPSRGDVIIMDDGLQNPQLEKDLRIAVVNGARGIGNGRVIPAGPLRAPLEFQLERVDCVVVNSVVSSVMNRSGDAGSRHPDLSGALAAQSSDCPILQAQTRPTGDTTWLQGTRIVAFAGIAHPDRFLALIRNLGGQVVATQIFNDHQPISEAPAQKLITLAEASDACLLTTTKDFARLKGSGGAAALLAERTRCLPVTLQFDDADLATLRMLIARACERCTSAT